MEKMLKQIVAVCSLTAVVLSFNATSSFAAGTGDNPVFTPDVKTPEMIKLEREKSQKALMEHKLPKLAGEGQKTIDVPSYKQETSYWCGPATTKQVLNFINGSSLSQSDYAKKLGTTTDGTDFSKIDDLLRELQSRNNYFYNDNQDYESWKSKIEYGVKNNAPGLLDLKISPKNMPLYTSDVAGHIINISGYDYIYASKPEIRITDPFDQGSRGVTLGNKWHPMDGVYNANQAHFRKAIIW